MDLDDDADRALLSAELAPLAACGPDPARTARTRARCQALLARRRRRTGRYGRTRELLAGTWRAVEPALVGALALLYVSGAVERALRVFGR
jgi:hypothetical protein